MVKVDVCWNGGVKKETTLEQLKDMIARLQNEEEERPHKRTKR